MTEAEARAILAEVEPKHAAWEREYSIFAGKGFVDLRPHLKGDPSTVPLADWRPRATRTPSGWAVSGGWLDEPVPPLPTLPERGVRARLLADRVERARREEIGGMIGELLGPFAASPYALSDASAVGALRETRGMWHCERMDARAFPANGVGRGWCDGLNGNINSAQPVTDKGWRMMQSYCAMYLSTTDAAWAAERAALTQRTEAA